MFFMSLISHILSAWFAFLLPCFATFKALNHLPQSEPELKRWSMYWSIVGSFVAFEYIAEWFISWLPFYWEVKTLFLLYLSLPQTQGSTYIYQSYLHPFLIKNEAALDAGIAAIQSNALGFIQAKLGELFRLVTNAANKRQAGTPGGSSANPASWQSSAAGLWNAFGPSVVSTLQQGAAGAPSASPSAQRSAPVTPNKQRNSSSSTQKEYFGSSSAVPNPPFPAPQHFQ